jgi:hypothetical protein
VPYERLLVAAGAALEKVIEEFRSSQAARQGALNYLPIVPTGVLGPQRNRSRL